MVLPASASVTAEPGSETQASDSSKELGLGRFAHVQQTADSIQERVRRVLTPTGFAPLRVLVVDDHPDAAETLGVVLELLGCPTRVCHDGWSALTAAQEFLPQICLIDLMMPGMDGLELASRLKVWAGRRPLLVVAVTALSDEDIKARTAIAGFHEHFTKPVNIETLIAALTRLGQVIARYERDVHASPYRASEISHDGDEELGHS
jgi:two-component system, OmpR family, response regulator